MSCLLCTNCADVVLPFDRATDLPPRCEGVTVEAVACQAIFRINYLTKEIRLQLINADDPKRNSKVSLSIENKFAEPKIMDANMTYTCKTSDDCAKLFYQSTAQMLVDKEPVLNQLRNELFDAAAGNVEQCVDSHDQPITCENAYGCHGYEIIENGKPHYEGKCRNATSLTIQPYLYFAITLEQGDPSIASDWNHLGYTCNKRNQCNTREQIRQMMKLANDFYTWQYIAVNTAVNVTTVDYFVFLLAVLSYLIN